MSYWTRQQHWMTFTTGWLASHSNLIGTVHLLLIAYTTNSCDRNSCSDILNLWFTSPQYAIGCHETLRSYPLTRCMCKPSSRQCDSKSSTHICTCISGRHCTCARNIHGLYYYRLYCYSCCSHSCVLFVGHGRCFCRVLLRPGVLPRSQEAIQSHPGGDVRVHTTRQRLQVHCGAGNMQAIASWGP